MARKEGGGPRRSTGPQRQPMFAADFEERGEGREGNAKMESEPSGFWNVDSISAFTMLIHTHEDIVLPEGQFTVDFCTTYTPFPFELKIKRRAMAMTMAANEAWEFQSRQNPFSIQVDGSPPF